ncbi:SUR7/PalI family-domain-containing protein, partial [Lipomyces arxii]|uniref:SUR7/PalI family-domain-containing protein n=1 Tax=Lipomyces arxii TaxID=56418 RepID=UPI0034CFC562
MALLPRAATPLSILLAIAFGLQLVSVISVPIVDSITLSTYQNVKFGVFGYCTPEGCSDVRIGYPGSIVSHDGDVFSLPTNARHSLTNLLIVHPIAAGFTLILLCLALIAHFNGPANSPRYLGFLLILTLPVFILSLLAFLVDILLFIPHLAWGGWIVLGATVIIALCSLILCTMRRTLSSRKAMRKRIFDNGDIEGPSSLRMNHMQFYPPGMNSRYEQPNSDDREVLIYEDEDGKIAKVESTTSQEEASTLSRDTSASADAQQMDVATPEHERQPRVFNRENRYAPVNQISPGMTDEYETGRLNNGASPRPQQQRYRRDPRDHRPPHRQHYGNQPPNAPPHGAMPNPYNEYPRDRLPRANNRGGYPPQSRRPPYTVVMPPVGSNQSPAQTPMESYTTARSEPYVEGETPPFERANANYADLPVVGTPVGEIETTPTVPPVAHAATPPVGSRTGTPVLLTAQGTEQAEAEYVPVRQAWAVEEVAAEQTEEAQETLPRQRVNSADYYDDIDPQYATEVMDPNDPAYMQTVSPISPQSSRSPYSEFRPPMPPQQSSRGPYQRAGPRVAMPPAISTSPTNQAGPYMSRPMYPQEYSQYQTPNSPDGSISSHLTSVSQRGVNPRYYQQGPPPQQQFQQGFPPQQRRNDRTDMMLRGNPDFELAGVGAKRRGPKPPQAPTLMVGRVGDSPYAQVQQSQQPSF